MKKRLAICFSGQPRLNRGVWNNFKKNIISPFKDREYEIDYFVHFWRALSVPTCYYFGLKDRALKHLLNSFQNMDIHKYNIFLQSFLEEINPVDILFDNPLNTNNYPLKNFKHSKPNTPYNYNSQYHSVKAAHELCRQHELKHGFKYDYVMRARTDLNIFSLLEYEECSTSHMGVPHSNGHNLGFATSEEIAKGMADPAIRESLQRTFRRSHPDHPNKNFDEWIKSLSKVITFDETHVCNDQFAISSSDNMYKYSQLLDFMINEVNDPDSEVSTGMNTEEGISIERILWLHINNFCKIKKINLLTRIDAHRDI